MDRNMFILNTNEQQKYSNSHSQHLQNSSSNLNEPLSVQEEGQSTKEKREILCELNREYQGILLNEAKWIDRDNSKPQSILMNESQFGYPPAYLGQSHPYHPQQVDDDNNQQLNYQGSLNAIHENLYDSHIGSYNDKMINHQNSQYVNGYFNFGKMESNNQYSLVSAQYLNECQTHTSLKNITYSNISAEIQQNYDTPHFTEREIQNTKPELYQHEQQQIEFDHKHSHYIQEFQSTHQPLYYQNAYADNGLDQIHLKNQMYSEVENQQKDVQDDEDCLCAHSYYYQNQIPQSKQHLYQFKSADVVENSPFTQKDNNNNNYLNNFVEYHQSENPTYSQMINYQETSSNTNKDQNHYPLQINPTFEDDSQSKSQQSDEQFLMNQSFADSTQSNYLHENKQQIKQSNTSIHNNQIFENHEIQGQFGAPDDQNQLRFTKKNLETLENQGELANSDIYPNFNKNHKITNLITNLDLSLQNEKSSSQQTKENSTTKSKLKEQQKNKDSHQQLQSLLKIFFPKQEVSSDQSKQQEEQEEGLDIIHLDKKNIVRNLIRAFIRYIFNKSTFPQIHQSYLPNLTENEAKQQLRKYFTKKKFNNFIIKQLVTHQLYGGIFKGFLEKEAINYLQHSNVKCKENHQKFITFLLKCYEDNNLLEHLESYVKNKKILNV